MLYSIGDRLVYEKMFRKNSRPFKMGRDKNYGGGIVFETYDEAKAYILIHRLRPYGVYGVECDTDNIYWSVKDKFYRLINNAPLVKL